MERLARLLPFRQFGRLRHLRNLVPCAVLDAMHVPRTGSLFDFEEHEQSVVEADASLPSSLPAFARVSLNAALNAEPARRAPVRVYHGPSRLIMVGTVDAVCNMIDRCIAEEHAQAA
ncbi:hypothetical protein QYH69_09135 [Paraburkholderia sp. SARCC-3016]|jgi:hypothetical protein|uniref:hypothetical protein n=1 Tax=Paraburkholderia sp. SARCC-3016 TaxID=3058611 RepID=UPI0028089BBB|nr:hypothetical protein [Paraburkholderia sp. SARCC-3016]MDQ7977403.1 hypothetical protein [Paraburkholderia sp. SARCC-3016]